MAPRQSGARVSADYVAANPDADPTATELVINTMTAGQWMLHRMDELLRSHGLTTGSFALLQIVAGSPDPLTPSQIVARSLGPLTSATVTGLLDTCERRGFIRREKHPSDRRKVIIALTASGREVLATTSALVIAAEKRWTAGTTKAERRALTDGLGRLGDHLRSPEAAPPATT